MDPALPTARASSRARSQQRVAEAAAQARRRAGARLAARAPLPEDRARPPAARLGRRGAEARAAVDVIPVRVLVGLPRNCRLLSDAGLRVVADPVREQLLQL